MRVNFRRIERKPSCKPVKIGNMGHILLFSLLLVSCGATPSQELGNNTQPQVVSTSTLITDWTATIGGDEIQLTSILQPGQDPHTYEPVPADNIALEKADLILYNGYNLEPEIIKLIQSTQNLAQKVAIGEVIPPLDFTYQGKSVPDPHVWGDVKNVIQMVNAIRDELIKLSPEDQQEFTQNAQNLIQKLEKLDRWITEQIQTIPPNRRQLITTHDAFQYYARAYGLEIKGTLIGISTEEQPSAQTVKNLAAAIKNTQIPAIFAETTINPGLIQTVAEEANVKLAAKPLYSDSLGTADSTADTYINMQIANTTTIVEALGGRYTLFRVQ